MELHIFPLSATVSLVSSPMRNMMGTSSKQLLFQTVLLPNSDHDQEVESAVSTRYQFLPGRGLLLMSC